MTVLVFCKCQSEIGQRLVNGHIISIQVKKKNLIDNSENEILASRIDKI